MSFDVKHLSLDSFITPSPVQQENEIIEKAGELPLIPYTPLSQEIDYYSKLKHSLPKTNADQLASFLLYLEKKDLKIEQLESEVGQLKKLIESCLLEIKGNFNKKF